MEEIQKEMNTFGVIVEIVRFFESIHDFWDEWNASVVMVHLWTSLEQDCIYWGMRIK